MSDPHLLADAALAVLGLAAPAAANDLAQPGASADTLTSGRLWSVVAAMLWLASVVLGGLALARSAGRIGNSSGRTGAIVALVAGLAGTVIGGLVAAAADGGPGTGYGIVGGFVALVIGLIAIALGGLALARSRRTDQQPPRVPEHPSAGVSDTRLR